MRWTRLLWLAGGLTVCGLTALWVEPSAIAGVLRGADPLGLILAACLLAASHMVSVARWRAILTGLASPIRPARLVRWYLLDSFANSFLPSSVGGDAVRAGAATPSIGAANAATSVIFDRLLGYAAVLMLAGVSLLVSGGSGDAVPSIAVCTALVGLGGLVLAWSPTRVLAGRIVARLPSALVRRLCQSLLAASERVMSSPRSVLLAAVAAIAVQLLCAGAFVLLARALGVEGGASLLIAVYCVSTAISVLPLSIAGLGVRETVAAAMFLQAGLEPSTGVAVSLAWFGLSTSWSAASGLLYLLLRAADGRTPSMKPSLIEGRV